MQPWSSLKYRLNEGSFGNKAAAGVNVGDAHIRVVVHECYGVSDPVFVDIAIEGLAYTDREYL